MNTLKEQNGKYYQQCQVVMLATDQKAQLHSITKNNDRDLVIRVKTETQALFCNRSIESGIRKVYHLYFLSDDEIKEGDWFINLHNNNILQLKDGKLPDLNKCKKIIATTDESLNYLEGSNNTKLWLIPKPSDSFIRKYIEEYNAGRQITDVLVEYDISYHPFNVERYVIELKINSDNTITITKLKDTYSREEVLEIAHEAWMKGALQYQNPNKEQSYTEFIKEKL